MPSGGYIYAIGIEGRQSVKIGKTTGSITKRLSMLQVGQPERLALLAHVHVTQGLSQVEKAIHRFLATERQRGEWFAIDVDQSQLEVLIARAVQWLAEEQARKEAEAVRGLCMTLHRQRLQRLREGKGLSRRQLETLAKIPHGIVSRLKSGVQDYPSVPVAMRLAKGPRGLCGLSHWDVRGRRKRAVRRRTGLGFGDPPVRQKRPRQSV